MISRFYVALTLAAVFFLVASTEGFASIQVDFQPTDGDLQPGFVAVTTNLPTLLSDGVTLTTTGLFFNRNSAYTNNPPSFTYANLLDDFAFAGTIASGNSNNPITLTFEGLLSNYDYRIQIWSADKFSGTTVANQVETTYTPTTGTGAAFSSIFDRRFNPGTNDLYSGTGLIRSDATGKIEIVITAAAAPGFSGDALTRLNGLRLDAVPEPATIAVWSVLGLLGAGVAYRQRTAKA